MNHGGGVSGCSTPETPRVQGSSSAGLEGNPKNCISSRFLRGANAHGLGPRSDHGFYIPDYLQSFLHRLQCWLSGCDELIRQQQDKTKFSPPCYSCILINICFLLGSLEKKKNHLMCIFVTLTEMSLMQKFIQLPNISCVVTKGFPPFSNLSTVSFRLQCGSSRCFFLSDIWQAALAQILWSFLTLSLQNHEVLGPGACLVLWGSLTIWTVALLVSDENLEIFWKSWS